MVVLSDLGKRLINSVGESNTSKNLPRKNEYIDVASGEFLSPEGLYHKAIDDGFTPSVCKHTISTKLTWWVGFFFLSFCFLGTLPQLCLVLHIYLIYRGIKKMFQKDLYMRKTERITVFVPDSRNKTCQRITGQKEEEVQIKVPLSPESRCKAIMVGVLYILISLFTLYLSSVCVEQMNNDIQQTEQQ